MPTYKVIAPGFFEGRHYHPEGKRSVLITAKPFNKVDLKKPKKKVNNPIPSWLIDMPEETAIVKKKREAQLTSREEVLISLAESVGVAREKAKIAEEKVKDSAKGDDVLAVAVAEEELSKALAELKNVEDRMDTLEQSTQNQVAVASTEADPDGEGTSFIDNVETI